MPYIHVRNIGPLRDTGRLNLTNVTLIIGKQSTGKSTLMKIISYCSWIEKRLMIEDDKFLYDYTHYLRFLKELTSFHRLREDEFSTDSYIEYESDLIKIEVVGNRRNARITKKTQFKENKRNFKQCYIPAERNFLFSIPNVERSYRTSNIDNIFNFILEWREAKALFTAENELDVVVTPGMKFYYDSKTQKEIIKINNNLNISPFYASTGVQTSLPVLVMCNYLLSLMGQANYSAEDYASGKNIENLTYRFFRMFVEEPEQNLFPESQYELVKSLVKILNRAQGSSIVFTSHSPYILTSINLLMEASLARSKDSELTAEVMGMDLNLLPSDFSAYSISEDGLVENIIDEEFYLIKGEYLDSISVTFDDMTYKLNSILYGND